MGTKETTTLYSGLTGHKMELLLKYADVAAELITKLQRDGLKSASCVYD